MPQDIETLLDAATKSARGVPAEFHSTHCAHWVDTRTNEFDALLNHLREDGGFGLFEDHLQFLGDGGTITSLEELAKWLIARGSSVGSEQAVRELREYLAAREIEVFEVMLLLSTHFDNRPFSFCNGVTIGQLNDLPNGCLAASLSQEWLSGIAPTPNVTSVLFAPFQQDVRHKDSKFDPKQEEQRKRPQRPIQDLHDARLCLSLARPVDWGVPALATGTVAGDHLPFFRPRGAWYIVPFRQPPICPQVLAMELQKADEILSKFQELDDTLKNDLRVPMERLNNYGSSASLVDRAIELRVCLDSLFGDDDLKGEIRFRLSLRSAQFLGSQNSNKKKIQETIKKAYDVTSTAVHNGILKPKKSSQFLTQAAALSQTALVKIIERGEVDWEKIELGIV